MKIICNAIILFLFTSGCVAAEPDHFTGKRHQSSAWESIAFSGPLTARHESGLVAHKNKIYVLGGRRKKPVEVFNTKTHQWESKAYPPVEIHHFQPVVWRNKIYVIGALSGPFPAEKPVSNVLIYDIKQDSWEVGVEIPKPRRRGAAGLALYKNKIYVVAGITNGHIDGHVKWLDEFNPKTGEWKVLPDAPRARDHFQVAIVDHKIYAAGGRRTSRATKQVFQLVVPEVDVFDLKRGQWQGLGLESNIPTPRAGTTSVAVKDHVLVVGGESGTQRSAHSEVEAFDIHSQRWQVLPHLLKGRHGTGAALVKNALWTACGSGNRGGKPELQAMERAGIKRLFSATPSSE